MLKTFIKIQGGDASVVDQPETLPSSKYRLAVKAETEGFVSALDAEKVGFAAMLLGAGRKTKEDQIDYAAGITLRKKIGDYVKVGDVLCELHCQMSKAEDADKEMREAYSFSDEKPEDLVYVLDIIS